MISIAEKLKNAPEGFKLYSPIFGECTLKYIYGSGIIEVIRTENNTAYTFNTYGQYTSTGECLLFPSKEQREWDNFSLKPKASYNFKPFDKVVVRDTVDSVWRADFFSHIGESNRFTCTGGCSWRYCLPYNEETAKLIGRRRNYKED